MTLEEKAKKKRDEAFRKYSDTTQKRIRNIQTKRRGVTPPSNPREGTIGIFSRRAG